MYTLDFLLKVQKKQKPNQSNCVTKEGLMETMGKNTLFLMKKVNVEKRFILFSASHDVSVMIVNLLHLQLSILPRSLGSDSGHSFRPSNAIQEIIADSKK
jgi:hypothetical protein